MPSLDHIKRVVERIASVDEIREHIYFFGGAIPYIYYGEESGRDHTDIDILVDESHIDIIRDILKDHNKYQEEYDSLKLGLDEDYGVKAWIDGIYVEFEPVSIENGTLKRYTFSPEKELVGIEEITYEKEDDLIVPMEINGKTTYCQSNELNKAAKEKYGREKDLKDAEFIGNHDIDVDKYERVKKSIGEAKTTIISYEESKKKKEINSMFNSSVEHNEYSNLKMK